MFSKLSRDLQEDFDRTFLDQIHAIVIADVVSAIQTGKRDDILEDDLTDNSETIRKAARKRLEILK